MKSLVGTVVAGKYRIDRILGKGGMGIVYEATNLSVGRRVALKRLYAGASDDPDLVGRLRREARATASIRSKHVVEVLDVVSDEHDEVYVVMELLEGQTLASLLRQGSIGLADTVSIVSQTLAGLEAAHEQGIIHRDLKPGNLFLHGGSGGPPAVKLLDFGISKWVGDKASIGQLTKTGATLGTPSYMAPEQARESRAVDQRSDIYSVGTILYECLTGGPPYGRDSYTVVLSRLLLEDPVDVGDLVPGLAPSLIHVVRRAMARDPVDRFPTARAMRAAIEECVDLGSYTLPDHPRSQKEATTPPPTPFAAESLRLPQRPRAALRAFAVGFAAVAVVLVGWLVLTRAISREPQAAAPVALPRPVSAPVQQGAAPPAPPTENPASIQPGLQVANPTRPTSSPVPPAAPRTLRVVVHSGSAQPRIVIETSAGELVGTSSPSRFDLPPTDASIRLTVRAPGYRGETRTIDATTGEVEIDLARIRTQRAHGPTIDDRNPLRDR